MLQDEEAKLAGQKRLTAELKIQKERERLEKEALEKQLEYEKQREAAIEKEFRERISSEDFDKSLNEENLGKLTERQIKGALIKKNYLQEKLKRVTNAFKYVQSTGTKVDADTLQRYEQVRKKVAQTIKHLFKVFSSSKSKDPRGRQICLSC